MVFLEYLSINVPEKNPESGREPCVLKHFKGALEAGAAVKELSYIPTLVMRKTADAGDCWTHDVLGD